MIARKKDRTVIVNKYFSGKSSSKDRKITSALLSIFPQKLILNGRGGKGQYNILDLIMEFNSSIKTTKKMLWRGNHDAFPTRTNT